MAQLQLLPVVAQAEAVAVTAPCLSTALPEIGVVQTWPPDKAKLATTEVAPATETVQLPVPVQLPLHPVNVEPELATADKVTDVPLEKADEQVVPQLMPLGELVTVPEPVPPLVTVKESDAPPVKLAVTAFKASTVTVQVAPAADVHPVQLLNVAPLKGVAVSVTVDPDG